mgnify:CR=1 FL=1
MRPRVPDSSPSRALRRPAREMWTSERDSRAPTPPAADVKRQSMSIESFAQQGGVHGGRRHHREE